MITPTIKRNKAEKFYSGDFSDNVHMVDIWILTEYNIYNKAFQGYCGGIYEILFKVWE